jgi:ParB family chromosome partitioning protein
LQIPIKDIIVKSRIRKNMGDLAALADSMKRIGQISPVVVNEKNVLLAGGRRLAAAKLLGWRSINAVIADLPEDVYNLEFEMEENVQRCDFTPEELSRAQRRLYKLKNPGFFYRILRAIARFFKRLFKL